MKTTLRILLAIVITLFVFGCAKSTESGSGTISVRLTDAPLITDDVDGVWVKFKEIRVNHHGWKSIKTFDDFTVGDVLEPANGVNGIFNLLDLQNGTTAFLASAELEAGHYSHIRIILDATYDHHLSFDNGTDASLDTTHSGPNGNFTTGHIEIVGQFTVEDGITTELILDFNAHKSVVKNGGGYKLHPSIRLVTVDTTGTLTVPITGVPADTRIVGYLYAEGTYATSEKIADANGQMFTNAISADEPDDGSFYFGYIPGGSYTLVIVTYNADGSLTDYEKQVSVTVVNGVNTTAATVTY